MAKILLLDLDWYGIKLWTKPRSRRNLKNLGTLTSTDILERSMDYSCNGSEHNQLFYLFVDISHLWLLHHPSIHERGFSGGDDAVKVLQSVCQQIWKTQQWPQDWKKSVLIPIAKKGNAKECSNYRTIAVISHASKVMLKSLQARLQQYVNFQMFKLVLEKAEEPEIKLPTSAGSWKKQESSRKTSISALLTMPKPLTLWITINCGKFWKRWEYQTTWPASWEICMQVRKQQLELDMEQQTGSI